MYSFSALNTKTACSERSSYSVASKASNSSYSGNSTATLSNEPTSLLSDDLMPEGFSEEGGGGKGNKYKK
jgi:hypothetical protein